MRRYRVLCSYDGRDFCGWQIQGNKRTVAGEITKALQAFHKETVFVVGASRTDKGVHALGQVFHYDSNLAMSTQQYLIALNGRLPGDIHIIEISEVDNDFHARYSVAAKHYRYIINNGDYDVCAIHYQWQVLDKLDVKQMIEAAKIFEGTHDFSTFCATKKTERANQVRTIYSLTVKEEGSLIYLDFHGKGFLRHMLRMLVEVLVEVGRNKITFAEVVALLAAQDKNICGYNAPAGGLYLVRVEYV